MRLRDRKRIRKWLIKHPHKVNRVLCYSCRGKGSRYGELCKVCNGTGKEHLIKGYYEAYILLVKALWVCGLFLGSVILISFILNLVKEMV